MDNVGEHEMSDVEKECEYIQWVTTKKFYAEAFACFATKWFELKGDGEENNWTRYITDVMDNMAFAVSADKYYQLYANTCSAILCSAPIRTRKRFRATTQN
jgi:hypothetical protein